MQRFLLSIVFIVGLLIAGSASAISLFDRSGTPVEGSPWNGQHLTGSGIDVTTPTQVQIASRPRPFDLPRIRRAFDWSDFEEILERVASHVPEWPHLPQGWSHSHSPFDGLRRAPGDTPSGVVPEPSTALLIGSGLVGLGLWRRERS